MGDSKLVINSNQEKANDNRNFIELLDLKPKDGNYKEIAKRGSRCPHLSHQTLPSSFPPSLTLVKTNATGFLAEDSNS